MTTGLADVWKRWWPRLGLLAWTAVAVAIFVHANRWKWSPGVLVLAESGWLLVLAAVARDAVANLFGPVFWYEVTRVGRKFSTFLVRFLYVLAIAGLLALIYFAWHESEVGRYGRSETLQPSVLSRFATLFFSVYVPTQFLVLMLITPAYVAGTITDEKERKTIDYLFTTDLANREIVFGKLAARLINLIMYVLAGLPVLAFLQLFGGIDPDLVMAATAATLVTVVGCASVGIFFSAVCRRSIQAIAGSYLVLVAYIVLSFILSSFIMGVVRRTGWQFIDLFGWRFDWTVITDWLTAGEPFMTFMAGTNGGSNMDPGLINDLLGRYAAFWCTVTVVCIGYATTRLRRISLHQRYGGDGSGGGGSKRGTTSRPVVSKLPVIGDNPLLWKEVFTGGLKSTAGRWVLRAIILSLVMFIPIMGVYFSFFDPQSAPGSLEAQFDRFRELIVIWCKTATVLLGIIVLFGAALRGATAVAGERDRDSWISLICAPVTTSELVHSKWVGAILSTRFVLGMLVVVWGISLAVGAIHILCIPVLVLHLAVYASAFALAGMWCSLAAKTSLGSSLRAFFIALLLNGGYWVAIVLFCILPIGIMSAGGGGGTGELIENIVVLPMAFTPSVMLGVIPMPELTDRWLGPFDPDQIELGPFAPFLALGAWGVINVLFYLRVRHLMNREANRSDVTPSRPPRRRREDEDEDDDLEPVRPRIRARRVKDEEEGEGVAAAD